MGRPHALLVALLVPLTAAAGCLDVGEPARSVPLESIAPQPPPIMVDQAVVLGYELDRIDVASRFAGEWNESGEALLEEMGYEPLDDSAYALDDGTRVVVDPDAAGEAFWLNASFEGFDVFGRSLEEAQRLADAAWREKEPEYIGTVSVLEQRAGWSLDGTPTRTNSFAARLATSL